MNSNRAHPLLLNKEGVARILERIQAAYNIADSQKQSVCINNFRDKSTQQQGATRIFININPTDMLIALSCLNEFFLALESTPNVFVRFTTCHAVTLGKGQRPARQIELIFTAEEELRAKEQNHIVPALTYLAEKMTDYAIGFDPQFVSASENNDDDDDDTYTLKFGATKKHFRFHYQFSNEMDFLIEHRSIARKKSEGERSQSSSDETISILFDPNTNFLGSGVKAAHAFEKFENKMKY